MRNPVEHTEKNLAAIEQTAHGQGCGAKPLHFQANHGSAWLGKNRCSIKRPYSENDPPLQDLPKNQDIFPKES